MAKYRKKPVVIEAFKLGTDVMPDWFIHARNSSKVITYTIDDASVSHATIETLEGTHRADLGDFIIKGVKGELYPCKPDIFEMTYEVCDD